MLGGRSASWMVAASVCGSVVCFSSPWGGGGSEAGVLVVGSRRSGGKLGGMRRGRSVRVCLRELLVPA